MTMTEPVVLGGFFKWFRLLRLYGAPDKRYIPRLLRILLTSAVTSPLRLAEGMAYGRRIKSARISKPPVFIVGFWRSGTTLLHNLLAEDEQFGCLNLYQSMAPDFFLLTQRWMAPLLAPHVPSPRPMDNMALSIDSHREDELALFNFSRHSLYYQMFFPKKAIALFNTYGLMETMTADEKAEWGQSYTKLLKKLTFQAGGRRLVMKNPANTGRLAHILSLFPDARFVHIHRNPFEVYYSCVHMFRKLLPFCQLQAADDKAIRQYVLTIYHGMMSRLMAQKQLIPLGNFLELRFEDLERAPLDQVEALYGSLGLDGFQNAKAGMAAHLRAVGNYRKNRYETSAGQDEKILNRWNSLFSQLGYAHCPTDEVLA